MVFASGYGLTWHRCVRRIIRIPILVRWNNLCHLAAVPSAAANTLGKPRLFAAFGISSEVFGTGRLLGITTLPRLAVTVAFLPIGLPLFRRYVHSANGADAEHGALGAEVTETSAPLLPRYLADKRDELKPRKL